jgi:hypothetical protein
MEKYVRIPFGIDGLSLDELTWELTFTLDFYAEDINVDYEHECVNVKCDYDSDELFIREYFTGSVFTYMKEA